MRGVVHSRTDGKVTRTIIGVALTAALGLLTWALKENYSLVAKQIAEDRTQIELLRAHTAAMDIQLAAMAANQQNMLVSVNATQADVKRLLMMRLRER